MTEELEAEELEVEEFVAVELEAVNFEAALSSPPVSFVISHLSKLY